MNIKLSIPVYVALYNGQWTLDSALK